MGVAYLAYSNQNFVRLTRELIALEFDGDFNALIPQISSEYTSRNYGNLNSELISASPEAINPNFLSSFFFADDEGGIYSLNSQVYSPDAEYWSDEEFLNNHENTIPIVVWCPYFDAEELFEDESYEGFIFNGTEFIQVMVDPEMLESNSVWVISLNEGLNTNENASGFREPSFFPTGCNPEYSSIKISRIKLKEHKERWTEGKSEVRYSIASFGNDVYEVFGRNRNDSDPWLGHIVEGGILADKVSRKKVKNGDWVDVELDYQIIYDKWMKNCLDYNFLQLIIYEYNFHGRTKGIVPKNAMVYDFTDDDGQIKLSPWGIEPYPTFNDSKDVDFDPTNSSRFQLQLKIKTARNRNTIQKSKNIPFAYIGIHQDAIFQGPHFQTFATDVWTWTPLTLPANILSYGPITYHTRQFNPFISSLADKHYVNVHSGIEVDLEIIP